MRGGEIKVREARGWIVRERGGWSEKEREIGHVFAPLYFV